MNQALASIVSVATAIVGIAIIAVLVSQRAQTSNVISSAGKAFSSAISAATAPVTGGSNFGFTGNAPGYSNFLGE
jgi:hypothetical protein